MNYSILQWIILLIGFIPMTVMDIKNREISIWFVACVGIAGIMNASLYGMPPVSEVITRVLPGFVLLAVAYLTKECIGKGDGLMCIALGLVIETKYVLISLFYGFILAALFGLTFMVIKKKTGKERIPFIPFIFGGVLLCGII